MSTPKVLGTIFFIELLQWLLLNYVLVSEMIFKKESNDIATTNREVPYCLLPWSSFCCLNLITAAPLQLEIKRFVRWLWANDITTAWGGVSNGTLSIMFFRCPNLMFLAPPWLEKYRFQTSHFADFEQFKVDICFTNFWQVKIHPIWSFLLT